MLVHACETGVFHLCIIDMGRRWRMGRYLVADEPMVLSFKFGDCARVYECRVTSQGNGCYDEGLSPAIVDFVRSIVGLLCTVQSELTRDSRLKNDQSIRVWAREKIPGLEEGEIPYI